MSTGYDNFWMHKNSRLKPVLNLPKNDNYSCALLTDNYKQVQTGGCPSHLNSFIQPQNTAATSHEKDQYRKSYDQSMWPSSIYSLPFMSSCENNLHSQEPLFTHANNFVYSSPISEAQEKSDFRHLEIPNGNVLPPINTNTSTLANGNLACAQNNQNTHAQIPRIRVKDVFSLNNNVAQSQLELDGGLFQQQKERRRYGLNFPLSHHNRMLEPQTQTEYIKYKKAVLAESNTSSQYEHETAKQSCLNGQEQFLQSSGSFCQQNDGFSSKNFEFTGSRQMENGVPLEAFKMSTPASLLVQLLGRESTLENEMQNHHRNAGTGLYGLGGGKKNPKRNLTELNNPDYSDTVCSGSCALNERPADDPSNLRNVTSVNYEVTSLPKVDEGNLISRNSSRENALPVSSKSPPHKENNSQQNCFIKISIPHTGESSFIKLNDRDSSDRNSTASLQSLLELNKKRVVDRNSHDFINDEENGVINSRPPIGQRGFTGRLASTDAAFNRGGSPNQKDSIAPTARISLISNHELGATNRGLQEFDALTNKGCDFQNSTGTPQQIQEKYPVNISCSDENRSEIPVNNFTFRALTLKQESFHAEVESEIVQDAQNVPGDLHQTIKTEEGVENLTRQESSEVVSDTLGKTDDVDGSSSGSKSASGPARDSEVGQAKNLQSSLSERPNIRKEEKEGRENKKGGKISISRVDYKSRINRDKLDLLIQFLKNDQDPDHGNENRQSSRETAKNNSCRSRRKLSKARIVRNKNNSREMISLVTLKPNITRRAAQITKRNKNLEKIEGKRRNSKRAEESINGSKKQAKSNNPCGENETKKSDSTAEPNKEFVSLSKQQSQESSEKHVPKAKCAAQEENTVINTVKAFQNLKTHFCMSCSLVLSIDSFWINIVSGELRCLNCFKRVAFKAEGNDAFSVKPLHGKTEKDSKSKKDSIIGDEDRTKSGLTCEGACRKTNDIKENIRQELLEAFGLVKYKCNERKNMNCSCHRSRSFSGEGAESQKGKPSEEQKILKSEESARSNTSKEELADRRISENGSNQGLKEHNGKSRRKGSSGEEDFLRRERHSSSIKACTSKEQHTEDDTKKQDATIKLERSVDRSTSKSDEGSESCAKKEVKADSSRREECVRKCQKVEERDQKDTKRRNRTDESIRKFLPQGSGPFCKNHAEVTKKNAWQESKNQNVSREDCDQQKPKTSKCFEWKGTKSSFNQNEMEILKRGEAAEQPRKRKNSDEDFSVRKVHIVQDFRKRDIFQTTTPSTTASNESDNSQRGKLQGRDKANGGISTEKSRKSSSSKEVSILGEDSRKEAKPPPEKGKDVRKGHAASQNAKPLEQSAKGKLLDSSRHKNKEQRALQKAPCSKETNSGRRRDSSDGELVIPTAVTSAHFNREALTEKPESPTGENRDGKKSEEKEGSRSSEKKTKTSPIIPRTPSKDGHSQKPDGAPKPLKEKQNAKTGSRPRTEN